MSNEEKIKIKVKKHKVRLRGGPFNDSVVRLTYDETTMVFGTSTHFGRYVCGTWYAMPDPRAGVPS